ncbi:hypothetical protein AgCh_027610 [Apium graveolens]
MREEKVIEKAEHEERMEALARENIGGGWESNLSPPVNLSSMLNRATPTRIRYWEALVVVCDWELAEARNKEVADRARVRGEQPPTVLRCEERGLHSSIVENLLEGRSYSELQVFQTEMRHSCVMAQENLVICVVKMGENFEKLVRIGGSILLPEFGGDGGGGDS